MAITAKDIEAAEYALASNGSQWLKIAGVKSVNVGIIDPALVTEETNIGIIVEVDEEQFDRRQIPPFVQSQRIDVPVKVRSSNSPRMHALVGGDHCGYSVQNDLASAAWIAGTPTIAYPRYPGGTIGACIQASHNGGTSKRFLLSCSHVLAKSGAANANDIVCNNPMLDVYGGHNVALLSCFTTIDHSSPTNKVDAAIAELNAGSLATLHCVRDVPQYNAVPFVSSVAQRDVKRRSLLNASVYKRGFTSYITRGTIKSVRWSVSIDGVGFVDQLLIQSNNSGPFSLPGDSGALVMLEATNEPVGLLIGGDSINRQGVSRCESIATFIHDVMEELKLDQV